MNEARPRWMRALPWSFVIAGAGVSFLMMAHSEQVPRGALVGLPFILLAALGLARSFGWVTLTAAPRRAAGAPWRAITDPRWAVPISIFVALGGALVGGYAWLPLSIAAALAVLLPAGWSRPGLLMMTLLGFVHLPGFGRFGLWDPWETHYGEVAREILARDDWISLWWCQDHWFWSKPILIFWSEALSMNMLGVAFQPDANPPHPEWAIRLPILLMAFGALTLVYLALKKCFSQGAGLLGLLVLGTMPHFFLIAHQSITDMPFVSNMTMALSCLLIALHTRADAEAGTWRWGRVQVSHQALVLGSLIVVVLPQVLYLLSRNVTFYAGLDPEGTFGFATHGDSFVFGSAGNGAVPGNPTPVERKPFASSAAFQPAAQGVFWLSLLTLLVWWLRRETRTRALWMQGFYLFCGFAFMGKGIPGFALPGLVALLFLIGSGRWSLLVNGELRVARGIVTVLCVGMPWYAAMYIRHGPPFTDRLLIHDHINRLAAGVHGDKGSIQYFIEQMGVGMFPWTGLLAISIAGFLWFAASRNGGERDQSAGVGERDLALLIGLWFTAAFVLFSAMITKFHHYIFPTVPPAAMLIGIALARAFPQWSRSGPANGRARSALLLSALGTGATVVAAGAWRGNLRGVLPEGLASDARQTWIYDHPSPLGWVVGGAIVALLAFASAWWLDRSSSSSDGEANTGAKASAAFRVALFATGVAITAIVARDLSWVTDPRPHGPERLIHLFVYNYKRPWPVQFDFRAFLWSAAVVSVAVLAIGVFVRRANLVLGALLGVSLTFSAWTLNSYIPDLAPHWGQQNLVKRYYDLRKGPEEPLVAWQMNWKGENFYTGNRVHVFQKLDNKAVKAWIAERPGTRVFFLLEHSRVGSFRSLARGGKVTEATDKHFNNKFILLDVTLPEAKPKPKPPDATVE